MQVRDASEKSPRRLSPDRPAAAHTPPPPERGVPRFESLASALTPEPHLTLPSPLLASTGCAPRRDPGRDPVRPPQQAAPPSARLAASPGAFLRRQVAPDLILDEDDESSSDDDAGAAQSMRDPQTRHLRSLATAAPPAATDAEMARRRRGVHAPRRDETRESAHRHSWRLGDRAHAVAAPDRAHAVAAPDRAHAVAAADGRGSGGGG